MMFGQLTYRESVRDIINCLEAHKSKVYHLGITKVVSATTLTRANESRDWRIWSNLGELNSIQKIKLTFFLLIILNWMLLQ